jgi:surface carbohydrate biosynthesis protein
MAAHSLIIPIETKVRELHAKCLLAAHAAEAGMLVVLGDQRVIAESLHQIPRGIYVDKSISRTKTAHFHRLRRLGFSIVAWCEEGLTYRDKAKYQFERVCPASVEPLDAFFAWGDVHKTDVLAIAPEASGKIHAHGNPRFDLLRPELREVFHEEANEIASRFGPYILINSNFSKFNSFRGREDFIAVLRARGILTTQQEADYYTHFITHLGVVFDAFIAMIPQLKKALPDHQIIVRPHPSEDHDRWRSELRDIADVHVIGEGNVAPWIIGATAVVHNACTTGVESVLLDRPTIAYVPVVHDLFNRLSYLPNAVSVIARTTDEVIDAARKASQQLASDVRVTPEQEQLLTSHVANATGALATERIVHTLVQLYGENGLPRTSSWQIGTSKLHFAARKAAIRIKRSIRQNNTLAAYMDQKFPGLSLGEIESVIRTIAAARPQASNLRVETHPSLPHCFTIRAAP